MLLLAYIVFIVHNENNMHIMHFDHIYPHCVLWFPSHSSWPPFSAQLITLLIFCLFMWLWWCVCPNMLKSAILYVLMKCELKGDFKLSFSLKKENPTSYSWLFCRVWLRIKKCLSAQPKATLVIPCKWDQVLMCSCSLQDRETGQGHSTESSHVPQLS